MIVYVLSTKYIYRNECSVHATRKIAEERLASYEPNCRESFVIVAHEFNEVIE